jgi:hypothetical protein
MQSDPTRKHLDFHDTQRAMAAMEVNYPDGPRQDGTPIHAVSSFTQSKA